MALALSRKRLGLGVDVLLPIFDVHQVSNGSQVNMKRLAVIPGTIALLRAHFDRGAGRVEKAKTRVHEIRLKYLDMFEFLDAFYGFLLIIEGDRKAALRYFDANLRRLPAEKNDNQRYIELYCLYFLGASKENFDWEPIISEAHQLKPDGLIKEMLACQLRSR